MTLMLGSASDISSISPSARNTRLIGDPALTTAGPRRDEEFYDWPLSAWQFARRSHRPFSA